VEYVLKPKKLLGAMPHHFGMSNQKSVNGVKGTKQGAMDQLLEVIIRWLLFGTW
jgi:hypothetical protein